MTTMMDESVVYEVISPSSSLLPSFEAVGAFVYEVFQYDSVEMLMFLVAILGYIICERLMFSGVRIWRPLPFSSKKMDEEEEEDTSSPDISVDVVGEDKFRPCWQQVKRTSNDSDAAVGKIGRGQLLSVPPPPHPPTPPRESSSVPEFSADLGGLDADISTLAAHIHTCSAKGQYREVVEIWSQVKRSAEEECFSGHHYVKALLPSAVDALMRQRFSVARVQAEVKFCHDVHCLDKLYMNEMLEALVKCKCWDMLDGIMTILNQVNFSYDLRSAEALAATYFQARKYHEIKRICLVNNCSQRLHSLNIKASLKIDPFDVTLRLMKKASGLPPHVVNNVISEAVKRNKVDDLFPLSSQQRLPAEAWEQLAEFGARRKNRALLERVLNEGCYEERKPSSQNTLCSMVRGFVACQMSLKATLLVEKYFYPPKQKLIENEENAPKEPVFKFTESQANEILQVCSAVKDGKIALCVFHSLDDPGYQVSQMLIRCLINADMSEEVCEMARKLKVDIDPELGALIMKAVAKVKDKKLCEDMLAQRSIQGKVARYHESSQVSQIVQGSGASRGVVSPQPSVNLNEDENKDDLNSRITLIRCCRKGKDLEGAETIFRELNTRNADETVVATMYNAILDVCVACEDMSKCAAYFEEMKQRGLCDAVSCNIYLKGYLCLGDLQRGRALIKEMMSPEGGLCIRPNTITYNELIHYMVQQNQDIWPVVDEMSESNVPVNNITCSIILKGCAKQTPRRLMEKAMELVDTLDEMDEVLFSSVIEACIRTGKLELLSKKLDDYVRQNRGLLNIGAATYGSVIKAYGSANDLDKVWQLWNQMRERNVRPTPVTLGCMVEALVNHDQVHGAHQLVKELLSDESMKTCVNTVIFTTILKGYSKSMHDVGKVFEILDEMEHNGICPNLISFNITVNALATSGCMYRIHDTLARMAKHKIEPDIITYATMCKGHCQAGQLEKGFEVKREMEKQGFNPDEIVYNCLLNGCAKDQCVDRALDLLGEMEQRGICPSNFTLSILVKLCGRSRRVEQAFELVQNLCEKHRFRPTVQTYTCLMQTCLHNRQFDRAVEIHETMVKSKVKPDSKTYSVLARGALIAQELEKAAEVVRCAYSLPVTTMTPMAPSPGMDRRLLDDVIAQLCRKNLGESVALPLIKDLAQHANVSVDSSVYVQSLNGPSSSNGRNFNRNNGGYGNNNNSNNNNNHRWNSQRENNYKNNNSNANSRSNFGDFSFRKNMPIVNTNEIDNAGNGFVVGGKNDGNNSALNNLNCVPPPRNTSSCQFGCKVKPIISSHMGLSLTKDVTVSMRP